MPKEELMPESAAACRLWLLLHGHERRYWPADGSPLPLSLAAVREAARDYGLSAETRELALALERAMLPLLQREHEKRRKA